MKSTGIKYLNLGEEWRKRYLTGSLIKQIAKEAREDPQTVSRAIWLAKLPQELKEKLKTYPEVFTRRVLLNCFASKRKQCEQDDFALLRSEVSRLILAGAGNYPKLPKKRREKKVKNLPTITSKEDSLSPTEAAYRIKQALGYSCQVSLDNKGGGEVRIFFTDKKGLAGLIETFEPIHPDLL